MSTRRLSLLALVCMLAGSVFAGEPEKFPKRFSLIDEETRLKVGLPEGVVPDVSVNEVNLRERYRYQTDIDGEAVKNLVQYGMLGNVDIIFLKDRVRVNFTGGTGSNFQSSWNDTSLGEVNGKDAKSTTDFHLKRLSLTLLPTKQIEITAGSFGPEYGAGSQNSYLDKDGYIMGLRAKVAIENGNLVVTSGYLGDYKDPNVFHRFDRMGDFNYVQVVLTQTIAEIVKTSLEYDHAQGDDYVRVAFDINVAKWTSLLDSVQVENMADVSNGFDSNILASGLKKKFQGLIFNKDLNVSATYAYNKDMTLPIFDELFLGHNGRAFIEVPEIINYRGVRLASYATVVDQIDDPEHIRAETGFVLSW